MRKIIRKAGMIALCLALTGCKQSGNTAKQAETSQISDESAESKAAVLTVSVDPNVNQITGDYSSKSENTDWQEEDAAEIILNNDTIETKGEGVQTTGSKAVITEPGTYVISGTLKDGRIIVDLTADEDVRLVLNNASLTCKDQAPLVILSAKNTYLTLAEGTENSITDGSEYSYENAEETEPDAALFSKDDLIINGTGKLTVNASYNDGIKCKDDLQIIEGTIVVNAASDGIAGKDSVSIKGGDITIQASKDGIKSSEDTDETKGYIVIDGGSFDIAAGNDGIQAATLLCINGGTFEIVTGEGSGAVDLSTAGKRGPGERNAPDGGGRRGGLPGETPKEGEKPSREGKTGEAPEKPADGFPGEEILQDGAKVVSAEDRPDANESVMADDTNVAAEESTKALKSDYNIGIFGGTFQLDSQDDALHCNQSMLIEDGVFTISTGDDALHSDELLTVNAGSIEITKSCEGLESRTVEINGGEITVMSADDGLNADDKITINGGTIYISASGDGIDSNGTIEMNGGYAEIAGPTDNGNGVIDYESSFLINGGILLGTGSKGMAQTPSSKSGQAGLYAGFEAKLEAGTEVVVTDEKGKTLYAFTPKKEFEMAIISAPDIAADETYTIKAGEQNLTLKGGESKNLSAGGFR